MIDALNPRFLRQCFSVPLAKDELPNLPSGARSRLKLRSLVEELSKNICRYSVKFFRSALAWHRPNETFTSEGLAQFLTEASRKPTCAWVVITVFRFDMEARIAKSSSIHWPHEITYIELLDLQDERMVMSIRSERIKAGYMHTRLCGLFEATEENPKNKEAVQQSECECGNEE
ncbi:hypothetical protein SISSUDRAFT_1030053 [Sistotremastrum suecicum HHB10207 ss-3]|uniref:Uncharacterized protein n=1 Tax=Sistotremastrum suecicum HHB10207 ss-3 TaxID=1314776 RepID=A0A166HYL8_9AGAM|nr:hypothetical protein SISSUDRAFT_1030053 [Sistotremastrum suecicum HHB10207 ss-3]